VPALIARLLLAFSVIAFLASVRAIGSSEFSDRLLPHPHYRKHGSKVTLASAWLSALWWAILSIFLGLSVLHIKSNQLENLLRPIAGCLLIAWILTTFYEYRRVKRSG
jgi:hypothetical protein